MSDMIVDLRLKSHAELINRVLSLNTDAQLLQSQLSALREENAKLREQVDGMRVVVEMARNHIKQLDLDHHIQAPDPRPHNCGENLNEVAYDSRCFLCKWDEALRKIEGK